MLSLDWLDVTVEAGSAKPFNVRELLDIDQTDLSNEFAQQSALYAYFGVLAVEAERIWQVAVDARKQEEADGFVAYKNDPECIPTGGRTVSDSLADKLVHTDEDYLLCREHELYAQHRYKTLKVIVDALYMRASMLQSIGATLRHEQDMTGLAAYDNPGGELRDAIGRRAVREQV